MSDTPAETTRELLVSQVTWEADGVVSLRLVDPAGGTLARWQPGEHIDVILPSGLVRQYSLCGDLDDRFGYRIAVLLERESRGGSEEIHGTALVGKRITVRGPRNHFGLVDGPRYLFLAGGIGVTPILPMLQQMRRTGRQWRLVYGGRSRRSMAFLHEIARYDAPNVDIVAEDELGFPDFDRILKEAPAETLIYCCGPSAMIEVVQAACERHAATDRLHIERFVAAADAAPVDTSGAEFEVELARTGLTLTVPPDRPLLQVLLDAIPTLLYSCEEGYCGTCEVQVLAGEPDHRDTVLTDEERADGKMMVCVGRSKSARLVLDL
jgi:ferredoxin-NADP reductase